MTHIQNETNTEGERPSSLQHGYRISLNLTRRVVRRVIELDGFSLSRPVAEPVAARVSNVPDPVSFQFSLRMLRRVVRRLIEESERGNLQFA